MLPMAFARSSQAMHSSLPRRWVSSSNSWKRKLFSKQPSDGVKQFWAPEIRLLSKAHLERWLDKRLQNSLPAVLERAIGRQLLMSFPGLFSYSKTVVESFQAGGNRLAARQMLKMVAKTCSEESRLRHTLYFIPPGARSIRSLAKEIGNLMRGHNV